MDTTYFMKLSHAQAAMKAADEIYALRQRVKELTADRDELLAAAIKAADEIRKCDYTPARSTLLVAIASVKEKS